ncbi:MAG: cation-transporting P-type ATPase [Anaerolineae bacterium]|nr:cation-transporting P-type ATPase [Anaerolineae bacterium]
MIERPWTQTWEDVAEALDVTVTQGLDAKEVSRRRERYGQNRLRDTETKSAWQILVEQFKSLIIGLLAVAAILSFAFGDWIEGLAVLVVIAINAAIGFITELRAVRSMESLQELSRVDAKVRRDGQVQEISAESLAPGDVMVLAGGDVITADARLVEASKLQVDEAALTGESAPVSKQTSPVKAATPLAERASMVYKGTAVTRGAGEAIVIATGMETELGHISSLVEAAEEEATPLEERLEALGRTLIWVTLGIAGLVALSGIIAGREIRLMIETAIALAVASIPEGLPIVATVALARGMWRMARRNVLINRLAAVETLGATSIILTDKTGTLTENRMTVVHLTLDNEEMEISGEGLETEGEFTKAGKRVNPEENVHLRQLLRVGVLCNNAALSEDNANPEKGISAVGDPLEVALLVAGVKAGLHRPALLEKWPEVHEVAFDAETKMMATYHKEDGHYRVAVKGALEPVLESATQIMTADGPRELKTGERKAWLTRNETLAEDGLRVIALATKRVEAPSEETTSASEAQFPEDAASPYETLTFLGLAALLDPPRKEVRGAIEACQSAGVRVVMVTGDQPATARNVAHAVGLVEDEDADVVYGLDLDEATFSKDVDTSNAQAQHVLEAPIFARVTPAQKLDLIAIHQRAGAIVAMTGDGVNDAPALKKADIGVAMGQRGTQVAKEAADMILKDDAFAAVVVAIEQGRVIFGNIRKFVLYLLSCNVAEILVVGLAAVVNAPLPIRPLQILFLNLVTDVFPALALGVGEGSPHVMERPPRDPDEPIVTRRHWTSIGVYSFIITLAVLGALALGLTQLGMSQERSITLSFLTLAFAQLWHVFNMRDHDAGVFKNEITENKYVWGALGLCVVLLGAAVYVPFLSNLLDIVDPGLTGWGIVLALSLASLAIGQAVKALFKF